MRELLQDASSQPIESRVAKNNDPSPLVPPEALDAELQSDLTLTSWLKISRR